MVMRFQLPGAMSTSAYFNNLRQDQDKVQLGVCSIGLYECIKRGLKFLLHDYECVAAFALFPTSFHLVAYAEFPPNNSPKQ